VLKKRRVSSILILSVVLLFQACGNSGVAGVDFPLKIDDIDFTVTDLETMYEWKVGSQVTKPRSSDDIILVVTAKISAGHQEMQEKGWEYEIIDENGRTAVPGVTSFSTTTRDGKEEYSIELVFGVNKNAESFKLVVQDNEIVLDSLMKN